MNGTRSAWPAVVIAAVSMLVAGGLAVAHVDREVLLLIMTISATPVITALVSAQMGETKGVVTGIQQQTNGNWAKALDTIREQSQMLASAAPAPAPTAGPSTNSPTLPSSSSTSSFELASAVP